MNVLHVAGLRTRVGGFELGPIDVSIGRGDFVSLIGPNGSGKSTLITALLGLNPRVVAGTVQIFGESAFTRPRAVLSRVAYVTDSPRDVLGEFTAEEYWDYCRLAFEAARATVIDGWDERVDTYARMLDFPLGARRPLSTLSLGTARKAQIIAALLPAPEFVVLDEPFIGLDFLASRSFEALLVGLREQQVTVLASSHDLDLAARVASRVIVLRGGRVVLDDLVSSFRQGVEAAVTEALSDAPAPGSAQ